MIEKTPEPTDTPDQSGYMSAESPAPVERASGLRRNLHKIFIALLALLVLAVLILDSFFGSSKPSKKQDQKPAPTVSIDAAPDPAALDKIQKAQSDVKPAPGVNTPPLPSGGLDSSPAVRSVNKLGSTFGAPSDAATADSRVEAERANTSMNVLNGDEIADKTQTSASDPNSQYIKEQLDSLRADQAKAGVSNSTPSDGGGLSTLAAAYTQQQKAQQLGQSRAAQDRSYLKSDDVQGTPVTPIRVLPKTSNYLLCQGFIIPAVLINPIFSDLVGPLRARVRSDVYDCLGKGILLIPKGSLIVGAYSNDIRIGQSKVLGAFARIIFPNGSYVNLPGFQALDQLGAAGIAGHVNTHFLEMLGSGLLLATIADVADPNRTTTVGVNGTTSTGSAAGQVVTNVANTALDRYRVIPVTINTDPALPINIDVNRDMDLPPYLTQTK